MTMTETPNQPHRSPRVEYARLLAEHKKAWRERDDKLAKSLEEKLLDCVYASPETSAEEGAATGRPTLSERDRLTLALIAQKGAFGVKDEPTPGRSLDIANQRVLEEWKDFVANEQE